MATIGNRQGARTDYGANGAVATHDDWVRQTRVFLQPIAAPSILGLFGFSAATFMVAANLAGWFGNASSGQYLFPFAGLFGGVAQFAAGMWAYKARDGLATAVHSMWGSFWMAFGLLELLGALHVLALPAAVFPAFAFWFIALAVITFFCFIAALGENLGISAVLLTLACGSALLALFYLTGVTGWKTAGGWVLLVSSWIACYTAGAMTIAATWGRTILPLGEYRKAANVPGRRPIDALQYEIGEPGVKKGQ
jgi:succinate-acetate transporter protein